MGEAGSGRLHASPAEKGPSDGSGARGHGARGDRHDADGGCEPAGRSCVFARLWRCRAGGRSRSRGVRHGLPSGTTIDLFDYWLTTESGPENPGNITSAGINAGNQLWFSDGIPEGGNGDYGKTINHYGGGGKGPHFGIVAPELGHDGYPVLAEGNKYSLADGGRQTEPRSLAYLFNPLVSSAYKRSYANATDLLQLDANGYYYYDSTKNFASYDKDAGRFVLYDGEAVDGSGFADSTKGMFFPFNTAEQVFTQESLNGSGPLESTVGPGGLNHYFGLSMTSYFMQPADG